MKLEKIVAWLDKTLNVDAFDDVSNNGLQIARAEGQVTKVAFAVDASVKSVKAAAKAGAELLVVHHGISWGGGIKRLSGGIYQVVREAIKANLAVYACHLPLDAHPKLGNNAELARLLKLKKVKKAFSYHGNVIGLVGTDAKGRLVGVCSGGAGEFAEEAKNLGCELFITGEASWGEVIAAENCGIKMECRGHYETETYGVKALARAMARSLSVSTVKLAVALSAVLFAGVAVALERTDFRNERNRSDYGVDANTTLIPVAKLEQDSYDWFGRHERILREGRLLDPEVVLIGDSITHHWAGLKSIGGEDSTSYFKEDFLGKRVLNLGFGWDRIQNMLWRVENGELDGLKPKKIIIMAGTNNMTGTNNARANDAMEIAVGVVHLVKRVSAKCPQAKIVVMGILPRAGKDSPMRRLAKEANGHIAKLLKAEVAFIDLSDKFVTPDGERITSLYRDQVHLSRAGYSIWSAAIK